MSEEIAIDKIRTDCGTQMRAVLDEATVAEYAECIDDLPPITVFHDGEEYYNADGFHRLAAHKQAGKFKIACAVKSGSLRDAILWACSANASHGRRRTREDKRRAVETLLRDEEWGARSDRWIADQVQVGHPLVASVREELFPKKKTACQMEYLPSERVVETRDGKTRRVADSQMEDIPSERPAKKITGGVTFNVDEFTEETEPTEDDSWATPEEPEEPEEDTDAPVDGGAKDGLSIPSKLAPAFAVATKIRGMVQQIGRLKSDCADLVEGPAGAHLDHDDTRRSLEQAAIHLKNAIPLYPCPRCRGAGAPCEWCRKTGYITRTREGQLSDLDKKWLKAR
jgi:hypothetical protein